MLLTCQPARQRIPESAMRADPSSEPITISNDPLPPAKRNTHNNMIAPRLLQHIRHQFGRDRRSALVFFVLPGIGKQREHRGDALRARDLAGVDHDAKLHQRGVDLPAPGVDNVHIVLAHGLDDPHVRLADAALGH